MKIAIYTIAKNEERFVDRWANSNSEADLRVVCDTGSTDKTVKKLQKHGVTVYPITVDPWRFDVARGTALNLLPADIDVCIWQDLDEELLPGWRQEIEKYWKPTSTMINHRYRHNDGPWQWHSKIHARHDCIWRGPVHETLKWATDDMWQDPTRVIWCDQIFLDEHQDTTKSRNSYTPLLELKIAEGDQDWKTYYFLAIEHQRWGETKKALEAYEQAFEKCVPTGSLIDLAYISRTIAKINFQLDKKTAAEDWFRNSLGCGEERESWFDFAEYCYHCRDWDRCYIAAKKCISIEVRRDGYTQDPRAWSYLPYDYAAISAHRLGMKQLAIDYGEKALAMSPTDDRLKKNIEFYKNG